MTKYFSKIFFAILVPVLLASSSCKKNNAVVDQDPFVLPTYAKFNVVPSQLYTSDSTATYYVKSTNETFKLPIGVTNVSDKDRTVSLSYTSATAIQGVQYTAPTSLTIRKGSALDTLEISGIFAGIGLGQIDTLNIQIVGTDEMPVSPYKNKFTIYMRKSCPIVITDFEGNYDNTYDNAGSYGPYTTVVTPGSVTMVTATSATFTIENVYDLGAPTIITVNADWTNDPDHPVVTIPDQEYFTGLDLWIRGTSDGTFSACDQTITLHYDLYYHTSGSVPAPDQETTMSR